MPALTWAPARRGKTYCSPACGHGCTWAKYQQAVQKAERLAKALGPFWKPRVWENLGWHWSARLEVLTEFAATSAEVHPLAGGPHFWVSLLLNGTQVCARGRTPKAALRRATADASDLVGRLSFAYAEFRKRSTP